MNNKCETYRVRKINEDYWLVEKYIMDIDKEFNFYNEGSTNYHIIYSEKTVKKNNFISYLKYLCITHEYLIFENDYNKNIDDLNLFLSTHYFITKKNQVNVWLQLLHELSASALEYYEDYNNKENEFSHIENTCLPQQKFVINKIKCINVGQANFSIGYEDDKAVAVFDIGVRLKNNSNRWHAINILQNLDDNGVVIISHYDADHINGYEFLANSVYKRIWILPSKRKNPTPIERNLISKLIPSNCIFLDDIDYSVTPFDYTKHVESIGNITIYRGNCKKLDEFQSTHENSRCLICVVENSSKILIPGDSLYDDFPTFFSVDYLIIPHHCCNYNKKINNIDIRMIKEAVIFAGPHSGYKHPNLTHINRLSLLNNSHYLMSHNEYIFDMNNRIALSIPLNLNSYTIVI